MERFGYKKPVKIAWGTKVQKNITYGYYAGGDEKGSIILLNRIVKSHSVATEVSKVRGFEIPTILIDNSKSVGFHNSEKVELDENTKVGSVLEIHFRQPVSITSAQRGVSNVAKQQFRDIWLIGELESLNSSVVNIIVNHYQREGGIPKCENVPIPVSLIGKVRRLLKTTLESI